MCTCVLLREGARERETEVCRVWAEGAEGGFTSVVAAGASYAVRMPSATCVLSVVGADSVSRVMPKSPSCTTGVSSTSSDARVLRSLGFLPCTWHQFCEHSGFGFIEYFGKKSESALYLYVQPVNHEKKM